MCARAIGQAHDQEPLFVVLGVTDQPQRQSRTRVISVVDSNFLRSLILGSMSLLRSTRCSLTWVSPPPLPKWPARVAPRCGTRVPSPWPTGRTPQHPYPSIVFDQRLGW